MTDASASTSPGSSPSPPIDWAAALRLHDRWLRTAVLARLGERQAVEEVMQEVALAAVEQRAPLAEPGKIAGWLYRLALRKVLLYRRKRGRERNLVDRFARRATGWNRPDPPSDPLQWLLREERQSLVRNALEHLNGRDAEILLLKYTEDWSYRALAEHLGIAEGAVESRLHRARRRLREALARGPGGAGWEVRE